MIPDVLSEEEINHYRPYLELVEIKQQNGQDFVHTDGKGQLTGPLVSQ